MMEKGTYKDGKHKNFTTYRSLKVDFINGIKKAGTRVFRTGPYLLLNKEIIFHEKHKGCHIKLEWVEDFKMYDCKIKEINSVGEALVVYSEHRSQEWVDLRTERWKLIQPTKALISAVFQKACGTTKQPEREVKRKISRAIHSALRILNNEPFSEHIQNLMKKHFTEEEEKINVKKEPISKVLTPSGVRGSRRSMRLIKRRKALDTSPDEISLVKKEGPGVLRVQKKRKRAKKRKKTSKKKRVTRKASGRKKILTQTKLRVQRKTPPKPISVPKDSNCSLSVSEDDFDESYESDSESVGRKVFHDTERQALEALNWKNMRKEFEEVSESDSESDDQRIFPRLEPLNYVKQERENVVLLNPETVLSETQIQANQVRVRRETKEQTLRVLELPNASPTSDVLKNIFTSEEALLQVRSPGCEIDVSHFMIQPSCCTENVYPDSYKPTATPVSSVRLKSRSQRLIRSLPPKSRMKLSPVVYSQPVQIKQKRTNPPVPTSRRSRRMVSLVSVSKHVPLSKKNPLARLDLLTMNVTPVLNRFFKKQNTEISTPMSSKKNAKPQILTKARIVRVAMSKNIGLSETTTTLLNSKLSEVPTQQKLTKNVLSTEIKQSKIPIQSDVMDSEEQKDGEVRNSDQTSENSENEMKSEPETKKNPLKLSNSPSLKGLEVVIPTMKGLLLQKEQGSLMSNVRVMRLETEINTNGLLKKSLKEANELELECEKKKQITFPTKHTKEFADAKQQSQKNDDGHEPSNLEKVYTDHIEADSKENFTDNLISLKKIDKDRLANKLGGIQTEAENVEHSLIEKNIGPLEDVTPLAKSNETREKLIERASPLELLEKEIDTSLSNLDFEDLDTEDVAEKLSFLSQEGAQQTKPALEEQKSKGKMETERIVAESKEIITIEEKSFIKAPPTPTVDFKSDYLSLLKPKNSAPVKLPTPTKSVFLLDEQEDVKRLNKRKLENPTEPPAKKVFTPPQFRNSPLPFQPEQLSPTFPSWSPSDKIRSILAQEIPTFQQPTQVDSLAKSNKNTTPRRSTEQNQANLNTNLDHLQTTPTHSKTNQINLSRKPNLTRKRKIKVLIPTQLNKKNQGQFNMFKEIQPPKKTSKNLKEPLKSLLKKSRKRDDRTRTPRKVGFFIDPNLPKGGAKAKKYTQHRKRLKEKKPPKQFTEEELLVVIREKKKKYDKKKLKIANRSAPNYQSPSRNSPIVNRGFPSITHHKFTTTNNDRSSRPCGTQRTLEDVKFGTKIGHKNRPEIANISVI